VDEVEQRRDEQARVFAEPEVRSVHTIEILGAMLEEACLKKG
jgi:hypothetical protein